MGLCTSAEAARTIGDARGGRVWQAHASQKPGAPYLAMFEIDTDDLDEAVAAADVSLHLAARRTIKPPTATPADRVIASFGMIRHVNWSHRRADDHWRDVHGPLALECHRAMCDYEQLSVLHTFAGPQLDGMAMCAFASRDELSNRFFNDDAARRRVIADVSTFADTAASLPRVVLEQIV